jgi:hypothetical protein
MGKGLNLADGTMACLMIYADGELVLRRHRTVQIASLHWQ